MIVEHDQTLLLVLFAGHVVVEHEMTKCAL